MRQLRTGSSSAATVVGTGRDTGEINDLSSFVGGVIWQARLRLALFGMGRWQPAHPYEQRRARAQS